MRPPPPSASPTWGPYSSSKDFDANMAFIIILVVCVMALTFIAHAAIHFLLRRCHQRRTSNEHKPPTPLNDDELITEAPPSLLFSPGTNLAGAELECAICLAEFAEGDGLRVLPLCRHAFHVKCVDAWLSSTTSCPTCRAFAL
ncbi:hypothetical protein J5N97_029394 [Dioscorea zingiberensis]|uniref:RING-type domain-containing protein n=1 Tax=Dioscorea zingiberensis TaxID=325984 RepID=A0A9D5C1K9_9LILI|nr:hypothetical protein J5N97_029394 [Dioscorea zingiberensis]